MVAINWVKLLLNTVIRNNTAHRRSHKHSQYRQYHLPYRYLRGNMMNALNDANIYLILAIMATNLENAIGSVLERYD
jgi:hypothetical protein